MYWCKYFPERGVEDIVPCYWVGGDGEEVSSLNEG